MSFFSHLLPQISGISPRGEGNEGDGLDASDSTIYAANENGLVTELAKRNHVEAPRG